MMTIDEIKARWDSGEGKPYKGNLIDWSAYSGDGTEPPASIGCMCAQGQVLHLLDGWTPQRLRDTEQEEADRRVAELLQTSVAHAVLLRHVNDSVDGAPSIVLDHPERILGDQAHIVLAFWRHLDRMTEKDWAAAGATDRDAAGDAAWAAAWAAAGAAAWAAAGAAAGAAAWAAAWAAAGAAAWAAAGAAAWAAAGAAAWAAAGASREIQGARVMREKGRSFYFLPLFGFADPAAVLAADERATA